jgi:hypothetical protein
MVRGAGRGGGSRRAWVAGVASYVPVQEAGGEQVWEGVDTDGEREACAVCA